MLVAGFEADIQALPQRSTVSATLQSCAAAGEFQRARVRHRDGGAPARLSRHCRRAPRRVSFGPALLYATGGLAYGRTDLAYTGTIGFPIAPTGVLSGTSSNSRTSLGYALGGGLEYAFWKNWSIKAEYLYYNLGRHSTISGSFTNFAPPTGGFSTASVRDDGHIV